MLPPWIDLPFQIFIKLNQLECCFLEIEFDFTLLKNRSEKKQELFFLGLYASYRLEKESAL